MPGAEESLLLLPAPRCSNAFSPCVPLLPSAPEPQTPTPCPWPGEDLSSGHDHHFGNFPGAAVQQLHSHAAQAAGDAGGRRVGGAAGAPGDPCHRLPLQLGQADPGWGCWGCKGKSCLCLCFYPTQCWVGLQGAGAATSGSRPQQRCQPRARRARDGSRLSPEVTILTCPVSFTCSSAWSEAVPQPCSPHR